MKSGYRFLFMEWECCGMVWQLQMWRGQPKRKDWKPTCPICGEEGKSWNELYGEIIK
jgi:hypothetical protein